MSKRYFACVYGGASEAISSSIKIEVETMAERKTIMEKQADVFFVVPGGVGTMDELFQILTLKYLERTNTPVVIVNICNFIVLRNVFCYH